MIHHFLRQHDLETPFKRPVLLCAELSVLILLVSMMGSPGLGWAQEDEECLACHSAEHGSAEAPDVPLIDDGLCARSTHREMGFACIDCHMDIDELPHAEDLESVNCGGCHDEIAEAYAKSVHGVAHENGDHDTPTCATCHNMTLPKDDPKSSINRLRISRLCGNCHSDPKIMSSHGISSTNQETLYRGSQHAKALLAGNENAPTCISCHGYHDTRPLRDPESRTNFMHVPETCGQCHKVEYGQFAESVHGKSAASGHKDAPVCTDCHGEHGVIRASDNTSPVSFFNLSQNTCGRCHSSIVLNNKFGIEAGNVERFMDSYHGLALQHGSQEVANCGSCHGNHLILPSTDPRSTVSSERLVETCGVCHPGITDNVLAAPIHADVSIRSEFLAAWVPRIYIPLILVIIGGMLLHNGVILFGEMRAKFRAEASQPRYRRFNSFEIFMHILLTISFIMLVVTGFALKNPDSWWVTLLSYLQMSEAARALLHRIAGVTLIVISILYAFYMVITRRGRSEVWAMMPKWYDLRHVHEHLAYHLGRRSAPPDYDRYDYTEKMEFWALVWGVIIMAVTGLILWFPILSFQYLPKWAIDIAELIHYYEAVLATLAILVWHFFFVMFHPEEYPMSVTWLSGKMTKKHLKHRHPREYERLAQQKGVFEEPEIEEDQQKGEDEDQ